MLRLSRGFTIVELLIVIVVIGILAAITIVAYNGIQERARASSVSSALSQAAKKVAVWQVDNVSASPTCTNFNSLLDSTGTGCSFSKGDVDYQYTAGTNGTYCVTATTGSTSYKITESTKPTAGGCSGHGVGGTGAVTNRATNPSFETNLTSHGSARGVITVDGTKAFSGASSCRYVADGTAGGNYMHSTIPTGAIGGQTVNLSIRGQRSSTVANMYVQVYFLDSVGTYLNGGGPVVGSQVALNTTGWTTAAVTATAPANTTSLVLYTLISPSSLASGATFWYDGLFVTVGGSAISNYYDGSSSGWIWNGTANASTSTGPPL